MDKIKTVKIKNEDGSISEESYTISVDAKNVDMDNGKDLQETIGTINIDIDGSIAEQLNNLNDNINNLNIDIKKKAYFFDTVADMKNADLKIGDYACTLGYYETNDGGAGEYRIINGDYIDDGGSYHQLKNHLYAELIIREKGLEFSQFGAYTNNTNSDITTNKMQQAINYCQEHNIHITDSGKSIYQINDTLCITKKLSMDLNYAIIRATTEDSILLFDEALDNDEQYTGNSHHGKITRIIIDCNNVSLKGIEVIRAPRRVFENLRVTNVPGTENNIGYAYYFSSTGPGAQLKLINCYADNKDINNYATVIYNAKSDIVVDGLDYVGFSRGIYHTGGNAYYNNCHGFITSP